MMHHFYLAVTKEDVRAMSAPFLPRVGDSIQIDGYDLTIRKIVWISNGNELSDTPMVNVHVHPDHALAGTDDLAERLVRQFPQRKIAAIKEHRALTGMGLKESKEAIDAAWRKVEAEKMLGLTD